MARIILVRGIDKGPTGDLRRMADALELRGWEVIRFEYSPVYFWNARWKIDDVARSIQNFVQPGDHAIGHSFGCAALFRAMHEGSRFGRVVFFGAALSKRLTFPKHGFQRLLNVTNPYDRALTFGNWLAFRHPFGLLGRDGYAGPPDDFIQHVITGEKAGPYNHTIPYLGEAFLPAWIDKVHEFLADTPINSSEGFCNEIPEA